MDFCSCHIEELQKPKPSLEDYDTLKMTGSQRINFKIGHTHQYQKWLLSTILFLKNQGDKGLDLFSNQQMGLEIHLGLLKWSEGEGVVHHVFMKQPLNGCYI